MILKCLFRSSSLYQPETCEDDVSEKDNDENKKKLETDNDDGDITYSIDEHVDENSNGTECDYSSDSNSEIEEEIND